VPSLTLIHSTVDPTKQPVFYYECLACGEKGERRWRREGAVKDADEHVSGRHPDIDEPDDEQEQPAFALCHEVERGQRPELHTDVGQVRPQRGEPRREQS